MTRTSIYKCKECQSIILEMHPDILFLNYKSQDLIKAESIYELQEHLSFTSFSRIKKFKLAG